MDSQQSTITHLHMFPHLILLFTGLNLIPFDLVHKNITDWLTTTSPSFPLSPSFVSFDVLSLSPTIKLVSLLLFPGLILVSRFSALNKTARTVKGKWVNGERGREGGEERKSQVSKVSRSRWKLVRKRETYWVVEIGIVQFL